MVALVIVAGGAPLVAAPVISGLSETSLDRSGRLRIFGSGFVGGGEVLIDGWPAIVGEWTGTAIHAYVPENAGPGTVGVQVVTGGQASNVELLDVTLRSPEGQVAWRFTCDSRGVRQRLGLAPDGTVYAHDTDGLLYALSPDGGLKWLVDTGDEGSEGRAVVGGDGTVYVPVNPLGSEIQIRAYNPDGSERWTFTTIGGQAIIAGPGIGPDGNIYAVTNGGGIGAFSLDPEGNLRWSHAGEPMMNEFGPLGQDIAFGPDRFFVAFDERAVHPTSLLYGFSFDGDQLFATPRPDDLAQPMTAPDGSVYLQVWGAGSGKRLGKHDADGNAVWTAFETPTNELSHPWVTSSGLVYAVRNLHELWAVGSDGATTLLATDAGAYYRGPVATPDGEVILTSGAVNGGNGYLRAHATDGTLLWEEVLPLHNGGTVFPSARALMTPDGAVAYVPFEPGTNPDDNLLCFVYALRVNDSGAIFADGFESGDTAAWSVTQQ